MKTINIVIKGKVQGVFFRATAQEIAEQLHLTGWVRNTGEGDVEAVATGTDEAVEEFVKWCHTGPSRANVTSVAVTPLPLQQFGAFIIKRQ